MPSKAIVNIFQSEAWSKCFQVHWTCRNGEAPSLIIFREMDWRYSRLEENSHLLKPPINNYCVYNEDVTVMVGICFDLAEARLFTLNTPDSGRTECSYRLPYQRDRRMVLSIQRVYASQSSWWGRVSGCSHTWGRDVSVAPEHTSQPCTFREYRRHCAGATSTSREQG